MKKEKPCSIFAGHTSAVSTVTKSALANVENAAEDATGVLGIVLEQSAAEFKALIERAESAERQLATFQQQAAEAEARAEGMREALEEAKIALAADPLNREIWERCRAALSLPATSALALHEVRTLRREAAIAKDLHGSIGSWLETRAAALERPCCTLL